MLEQRTAPEKDEDSIIGDLLDYYSSRAVAHASFFIASIFGIVTLSAVIQQLSENVCFLFLSMLLFFGFSYVGYFTMIRFGFYADLAASLAARGLRQKKVMEKIRQNDDANDTTNLFDHFSRGSKKQTQYLLLRRLLVTREVRSYVFLGCGYWFGIFLLGLISYERFLDVALARVSFFIVSELTLLIVILPIVIERYGQQRAR